MIKFSSSYDSDVGDESEVKHEERVEVLRIVLNFLHFS